MEMFFAYYLWIITIVVILIHTHKTGVELATGEWIIIMIMSVIPIVNVLIAMN
jgi:hypothetical protein